MLLKTSDLITTIFSGSEYKSLTISSYLANSNQLKNVGGIVNFTLQGISNPPYVIDKQWEFVEVNFTSTTASLFSINLVTRLIA